jgi:monolysocardiolipin acyltransferase
MESRISPVVIPMWITGFDQLMPKGRPFPYKYVPRVPAKLSVTFGRPIETDVLRQTLNVMERDTYNYNSLIRQKVTAIIQRDVEALGRLVSGDSLRLIP